MFFLSSLFKKIFSIYFVNIIISPFFQLTFFRLNSSVHTQFVQPGELIFRSIKLNSLFYKRTVCLIRKKSIQVFLQTKCSLTKVLELDSQFNKVKFLSAFAQIMKVCRKTFIEHIRDCFEFVMYKNNYFDKSCINFSF